MIASLLLCGSLVVTGAGPDGTAPPGSADQAVYEAARAAAGRDADAHVALALWCEAHGMAAEKSRHLARAVLLDPSHAKARGLLGFVNHDGKWMRPEEVSKAVEESPEAQALFREYQERRIGARDKADDQYKLAKWCEEKGLEQQATAHYRRVVELDSGREGAWRSLGFKKISGRWAKPEIVAARKAEREAQAKADKFWKSRLLKLKDDLSSRDKEKRAEALEAIANIDDPRAAPMVWRVFAGGEERWQRTGLQLLSQIDSPRSSIGLATLAVFHPSAELRSLASQVLMRRDPRDFAGTLIGLLRDEIEYKVKPVNGPGSQGELLIKGKDAHIDRLYRPMQGPPPMPDGWVTLDDWGYPVVKLYMGSYSTQSMSINTPLAPDATAVMVAANRFPQLAPHMRDAGAKLEAAPMTHTETWQKAFGGTLDDLRKRRGMLSSALPIHIQDPNVAWSSGGFNYTPAHFYDEYTKTTTRDVTLTIPVGWMMMQARESAAVAQQQLSDDVQQLEAYNSSVRGTNERVRQVLKSTSGRDEGPKRESWEKWFVDFEGYAYRSQPAPEPPTIVQDVPINYQPNPIITAPSESIVDSRVNQNRVHVPASVSSRAHSCFAAGTPVRTLRGSRPIEEIRAGDEVLTLDTASGRFDYRPVVTAYHNPPNETYRLDLGKESIVATGIHRFWKAGRGWVMARDVKPGDRLRTVGGSVAVVAVEKDRVQPVYNLQLDGGDDFCVGESGVIAHDNSFVEPVERPFDAVPTLAVASPTRTP